MQGISRNISLTKRSCEFVAYTAENDTSIMKVLMAIGERETEGRSCVFVLLMVSLLSTWLSSFFQTSLETSSSHWLAPKEVSLTQVIENGLNIS